MYAHKKTGRSLHARLPLHGVEKTLCQAVKRRVLHHAARRRGSNVAAHGATRQQPVGLMEIPNGHGLPDLGLVEFVLIGSNKAIRGPAAELPKSFLQAGFGCERSATASIRPATLMADGELIYPTLDRTDFARRLPLSQK